jgi:hypothetical protein
MVARFLPQSLPEFAQANISAGRARIGAEQGAWATLLEDGGRFGDNVRHK